MASTVVNANSGIANAAKLLGIGLGGVRFEEVAIGTGTTAPAATQTALVSEISTGGGERKTGANVTVSLTTENVSNDTILFSTSWGFTASFAVGEFAVFTNEGGAGTMWFRGRFETAGGSPNPINVQGADTLEAFIYTTATDESSDAFKQITNGGLEAMNRLLVEDVSPSGTRVQAVAIGGDDGSTLPLAATNTALGDEFLAADGFTLARGEEITGPTVSLATVNVTDDTVVVTSEWEVTAPDSQVDVEEVGLFDDPAEATGTLYWRHFFTNGTYPLFGNDTSFSLSRGNRLAVNARTTVK